MIKLHFVDVLIIILYLLVCVVIGIFKFRSINTLKDFGLSNNRISTPVLVITIFATYIGAGATIGVVSKVYSIGIIFAASQLLKPLFWIIMGYIYANNIAKFKDCYSISDIMGKLYGNTAKWITNIGSIILAIGITSIQITAIGHLMTYCLGISLVNGIITGVIILIMYTAMGGIKAVTITDVFQFGIFFIIMPIAFSYLLRDLGNIKEIYDTISIEAFATELKNDKLGLFLSLVFYSISPGCGGAFVQKFLMAEDAKQLKKALNIISILHIPFIILMCLIGFVIKIKFPDINSELAFNYFISHYLPIGLNGLLIAGMLAVMMSTADSWINNASITFAHDIIKQIHANISEKQEVLLARGFTVFIGMISIALATTDKGVLDLLWLTDNFWDPLILVPLIAGINQFRCNSRSYIISVIFALIFISFGVSLTGDFSTISFSLGILGSALGLFGSHFIQHYTKHDFNKLIYTKIELRKYLTKIKHAYYDYKVKVKGQWQFIINNKARIYKEQFYTFSIFGIVYYISPFFIASFNVQNNLIENTLIYMYVLAAFFCLILSSFELWSAEYKKKYLDIYWYLLLTFCLPFLNTFILLFSSSNIISQLNALLSTLLLAMLVDFIIFILILVAGCILAYIFFAIIGYNHTISFQQPFNIGMIVVFYAIPTIATYIFSRNKEKHHQNEYKSLKLFAGSIAHELHNPLASLNVISKYIKNEGIIADKAVVVAIENNVKRAQEIINNTLNNIKENFQLSLKLVKIEEIIKEALYELSFKNHNNLYINNIPFEIFADELLLKQVFINIIQNAYYYIKDNPNGRIDINFKINNDSKIITIEDNGPGIQESNIDKIFQPFYTTKLNGNGIGLAFCKKALEAMNAKIQCTSEYGVFTRFTIVFPYNI